MSGKWRVYNRHEDGLTHREKFRGEEIVIKAGDYKVMDYEDAVQFRGQYFPFAKDSMGQQTPESKKMIRLEPHDDAVDVPASKFICQMDGKSFDTEKELLEYTRANFGDKVFKDDLLEAEIEKSKKRKSA